MPTCKYRINNNNSIWVVVVVCNRHLLLITTLTILTALLLHTHPWWLLHIKCKCIIPCISSSLHHRVWYNNSTIRMHGVVDIIRNNNSKVGCAPREDSSFHLLDLRNNNNNSSSCNQHPMLSYHPRGNVGHW